MKTILAIVFGALVHGQTANGQASGQANVQAASGQTVKSVPPKSGSLGGSVAGKSSVAAATTAVAPPRATVGATGAVGGVGAAGTAPRAPPAAAPGSGPSGPGMFNGTIQDRSFFSSNPIVDTMILSTLAPKSSSDDSSASSSSSSSSDLASTLLVASMLGNNNNNNNNNNRNSRGRNAPPAYRQPQYVQQSTQFAPVSQFPATQFSSSSQFSSSTQFAPSSYTVQQQPQYFAPQQQFAPQRSQRSSYDNGYGYGYDQQEDPLKKMVLLTGVTSGNINPLAAVAMDNNKGMSTTDAVVMSSLGNSPASTLLAVSGGLGGNGNNGGSSNTLATLALAGALGNKKTDSSSSSSSSGNSALNTLALMSVMSTNGNGGMFGR